MPFCLSSSQERLLREETLFRICHRTSFGINFAPTTLPSLHCLEACHLLLRILCILNLCYLTPETTQALTEGLKTISLCSDKFFKAREAGSIEFDDATVQRGLELIAVLLARTAEVLYKCEVCKFQHWMEHGPQLCDNLIAEIAGRDSKILAPA